MRVFSILATVGFLACVPISVGAAEQAPTGNSAKVPVVVFGFDLIDTSLEGEMKGKNPDETKRVAMLGELLPKLLEQSGHYQLVGDPAAIAAFQEGHNIQGCNGCDGDFAKKAGAKLAISGTVQKVSNLILNINLYVRQADSGKFESLSTDIRSNSDDSWRRGLESLTKRLLKNPIANP